MNNEELKNTLTALRSGDMVAFEKLYNDLKTPIYTVIVRITRDQTLSEDILQELFIKLYSTPPATDVQNPRAYIFRIARNMAIDCIKKQHPDISLDEATETAGFSEPDIHTRLDIEKAMNSLELTDRQIITLHVNAGFAFREVAQITDMPLGTVLWRYQRAVSRLRSILSGGIL